METSTMKEYVIWQCFRENQWIDYQFLNNKLIEKAFKNQTPAKFKINQEEYYIDFKNNEQVNSTTKKRRKVRRYRFPTSQYSYLIHSKNAFIIPTLVQLDNVDDKEKATQELTKWEEIDCKDIVDTCSICLTELQNDVVKLSQCKDHYFHRECISLCFKDGFLKCPLCSFIYGTQTGTQPPGKMKIRFVDNNPLEGYEDITTIEIYYIIKDGIQGPKHPNPGMAYTRTARTCYLPYTKEGIVILEMLIIAWNRRLIFSVGTSVTTGKSDIVVWNGIHHKSNMNGGSSKYGYPDPGYFERVTKELNSFGISVDLDNK